MQVAHETTCVVINFAVRPGSPNQNDIRRQSLDLSFNIVHPAERKNLVPIKPYQIRKRPSLNVHLLQCQRSFHASRKGLRTEIMLVIKSRVNTKNDLQRELAEFVVLAAAHRDQLIFRDSI